MINCTKHRQRNCSREQQKQHYFHCDHLPQKIPVNYLKHSKFMFFIFAQFISGLMFASFCYEKLFYMFFSKKPQNQPTSTGKTTLASQHLWLEKLEGWVPSTTLATSRPEEWNSCCSLLLRCAASAPKEALFFSAGIFLGVGIDIP